MDNRVSNLMTAITHHLVQVLGDNLIGVYLHGSVAFGCFIWENSDIDFLVVTEKEPDFNQKKDIIKFLLESDKNGPEKGFEVSFVLAEHCRNFVYPTPYQLHFSNGHKEKYLADIDGHIRKLQGTDKDLAAHFTVTNRVGITFYGMEKNKVFSPVPKEFYLDSIKFDIENAVEDITEDSVYLTLNLCRVLAYIQDNVVISKADGGLWGVKNIPQYKNIIETAYKRYTDGDKTDFDNNKLIEFAKYMTREIYG